MTAIRTLAPLGLALAATAQARPAAPEPAPGPLAVGEWFHCALQDGQVACWGRPGGLPETDPRAQGPWIVPDTAGASRVAAGPNRACAVLPDAVSCWDATATTRFDLPGVVDVTVGAAHACALTADGRVWCWGENGNGQVGTAGWADAEAPTRVPGVKRAVAVRAGRDFSCAVEADGRVLCWGADVTGRAGANVIRTPPTPVGIDDAVALDTGFGHACAVRQGGRVSCWGRVGPNGRAHGPEDVDVSATAVAAGFAHTCALDADGAVRCWGDGAFGLLGDGTCKSAAQPVVAGVTGASALDASWTHTCATVGSELWCWGGNWSGEPPLPGEEPPCDASFAVPTAMPTTVQVAGEAR